MGTGMRVRGGGGSGGETRSKFHWPPLWSRKRGAGERERE